MGLFIFSTFALLFESTRFFWLKSALLSNKVHSNLASILLRCKRPINRVQHCRRNDATKLYPLIHTRTKLCIHGCNHSHCIQWDPLERFNKDHKLLLGCMWMESFFQTCHFISYKRLCLSEVLPSYMPYLNEWPNSTKAPTLILESSCSDVAIVWCCTRSHQCKLHILLSNKGLSFRTLSFF